MAEPPRPSCSLPRPDSHDLTPLVIAWQATLLQSSNVAYKFGVSGPFWYAAGATVQIILFAIVAIEIKRKCPAIHTMLEVGIHRVRADVGRLSNQDY